jgi:uncharacterized protein (TIGR03000 family)
MRRFLLAHSLFLAALVTLTASRAVRAQAADTQERRATLIVRVYPDAKLTVDGAATKQTGEVRRFYSPPLEPGKNYSYTLVAEWMPRNNYETYIVTRKVKVEPGKSVEIDMSKWDPKQGDKLMIRFVETPDRIVDAMLKLANVGKDDVVYDLGCGDGRIVVTAVKKFNAKRGVGVDLEPERINESKERAKEAGVEDKVEFRVGDVLKVDVSEATVVTLYMSDELNKLLMPKLREQLKPGARIVSHRFTMGDWKPDKTEKVDIEHDIPEEKLIHLWTIKKK